MDWVGGQALWLSFDKSQVKVNTPLDLSRNNRIWSGFGRLGIMNLQGMFYD